MHAKFLRLLLSLIFLIFIQLSVLGQTPPKLEVKFQKLENGQIQVIGINNSDEAYTFFVDFFRLTSLSPNVELPHVQTVNPGKSLLFTLLPFGISPASYTKRIRYFKGVLVDEKNPFIYSLPIATGKEAQVYSTLDTSRMDPDKDFKDYIYELVVKSDAFDSLYASRAGKVKSITSSNLKDPQSQEETGKVYYRMQIQHRDGSIGRYGNILPDATLAKVGDEIIQGQAIARFSKNTFNQIYFSVKGLTYNREEEDIFKAFKQGFQFIKFKVNDAEPILILDSAKYKGYLTEEMIMQEMTKKQKRRYLKKRGN